MVNRKDTACARYMKLPTGLGAATIVDHGDVSLFPPTSNSTDILILPTSLGSSVRGCKECPYLGQFRFGDSGAGRELRLACQVIYTGHCAVPAPS
jgi:hypothetical protein